MPATVTGDFSDMYINVEGLKHTNNDKIPLELTVKVYNINPGHNPQLLKECKTLDGYSFFIDKIREHLKEKKLLVEAVDLAVEYCIKKNILKKYLQEHRSEVYNMIYGEYNREIDIAVNRKEAWEDGRTVGLEKGMKKGRAENRTHVLSLIDQGLTIEEIKERLKKEK